MPTGIDQTRRQTVGSPTSFSGRLAAQSEEAREGKRRGGRGLPRGVLGEANGALNREESRRDRREETAVAVLKTLTSLWVPPVRYFLFFYFLFLFSFLTFDLKLQIKSNKFVKICKIPNSQNRHLGTIFGQNKITKIPF